MKINRRLLFAPVFVVVITIAALGGVTATTSAQTIPAHPRQLTFDALEFEPPAAERH